MAFNFNAFLTGMTGVPGTKLGDLLGIGGGDPMDKWRQTAPPVISEAPMGAEGVSPEILVQGSPPVEERVAQQDASGLLGNRDVLEEAQYSMQQAPERKGMFGVKGTLRDVLGTIGDAFLIQGGRNPIYAPRREQEKMGDAMTGFTGEDPESVRSAAERLASLGYVDQARKLMDDYESNQLRQAQIAQAKASSESLIGDRKWGNVKDATNMIARVFADPRAQANPQIAMAQAEVIARQAGVSLEDLGISPEMTPEEMGLYSRRDMTVNQQEMLPRRDRALDQGDRRLNISQQNADRPRAAPRPRSQTSDERYIEIANKPASQRTAGEKAWLERQNRSGSSKSERRNVPKSTRFR